MLDNVIDVVVLWIVVWEGFFVDLVWVLYDDVVIVLVVLDKVKLGGYFDV